jgi:adenine-specific DNA-methyltransferase
MPKNDSRVNKVDQTGLYWPEKRTEVDRIILPFQTVETINESKADRDELTLFRQKGEPAPGWRNKLIWGDNKFIMASLLPEFAGKINLIYIDPPFATGADFSINIKLGDLEWTKEASVIEEKAYRDTWGRGLDSYLQMMYDRLVLMRELLTENGSIYVHLDWHVGHYLKIVMDEVFGKENFVNHISWMKLTARKSQSGSFSNIQDIILLYVKNTENVIFQPQFEPYNEVKIGASYNRVEEGTGRIYGLFDFTQKGSGPPRRFGDKVLAPPPGKHWIWSQQKIDEGLSKGLIVFTSGGMPRIKRYLDESEGRFVGDMWFDEKVAPLSANASERTGYDTQKPEALLERIVKASSKDPEQCAKNGEPIPIIADFFCGSGTTLAVAEKLGRRWIGADLSKFAIHTTRKRLLDIPDCKPFEVLNLGKYQKAKLKENGITRYIEFILKLYRAEPLSGYTTLHGKKAGRMVHIGDVDSIVTEREIRETVKECASAGVKSVDILGWDFEMGLHDLVDRIGDEYSVKIRLVQIPREALEVRDAAKEEVKFFDLNYLEIEHKLNRKAWTIALKDFVISNPEYLPEEIREKVKKFTDYIDYWAVDFDYKEDTFHNMWQSFRTRKHPTLEIKCSHTYEKAGKYQVLVKVVDIFGNDTNKLLEIKVS